MPKNNSITIDENKKAKSTNQELVKQVVQNPELIKEVLDNPKVQAILVQKHHSGPLPPAEDLAIYNKTIPDGANRIMTMAEKAQDYGYDIKKNELKLQARGQYFAIFVVILFAILAGIIAFLGDTKSATLLMGGTLASIIATFLFINRK